MPFQRVLVIYCCLPPDRIWFKTFLILGGFRGGKVGHELKLVPDCPRWSEAHWLQCEPSDPAGLWLTEHNVSLAHSLTQTRRSCAMLCLSMILCPPEGGRTRASSHSTSKLSLSLIPHPARMPDSPAKKLGKY